MARVVREQGGRVLVSTAQSGATNGQVAQALALAQQALLAANGEYHLSQDTGVSINNTITMQDKISDTTATLLQGYTK